MKMPRKFIAPLLVAALVLTFCGQAFAAQDAPGQADRDTPVRVAMLQYPNFIDYDENGKPTGFSCDYLNEIAKYTGWTYEYIPVSFSDAQKMLENGELDIIAGTQYTEERAARYDYSAISMAADANVLCVPAANTDYCYNDYAALEGKTIGVMTSSIRKQQLAEVLDKRGVSVHFMEFDTDDEEKAALRDGTVAAVLMTTLRCTPEYRIIASANASEVYFTCNPHDPTIKAGIDMAQQEILDTDPYYNLRLTQEHYGGVPRAYAFSDEERDFLNHAEPITVAVSPDQKPIEYYDEKSEAFQGLVIDYFEAISEITGLQFRFVVRGDKSATAQALADGSIQLIASVAEKSTIEDYYPVTLTNSYYQNNVSLVYRSSVPDPLDTGCRIALKSGFVYYQTLAKEHGYTDIQYYDTLQDCVEAVNRGEADATYLPGYSAARLTSHAYYTGVKVFASTVSEYPCAIAVSKACSPLLVSVLDKALAAVPSAQREAMLLAAVSNNADEKTLRDVLAENLTAILCAVILLSVLIGGIAILSALRRKKANLQLAAARDNAQRANAAKSDFLSRMSHDMRTPMNGIIGLTALTADLPGLPQEARTNLAAIDESGKYLMNLINDVLDMNKIESAKLTLHEEPLASGELVQHVLAAVRPLAEQKKIALRYEPVHMSGKTIRADRVRLQQIFINIISNAVKFTPEGGSVEIKAECLRCENGRADMRIEVRDSGVGMSEEYLPHLFEPFSQEDRTAQLNYAGTGLGMSIVKNLVDLMDGKIEVSSKLNEGTTITVYLGFACVADAELSPGESGGETAAACLAGKRVLLVEDHPLNTQIAVKLLEKKGVTTACAENGKIGVAMFEQSPPGFYDAVLMDIRMPVMNGMQAAKAIRALPRPDAGDVPIIAMTANAFDEDARASLEAGMNGHLTKPIDPSALYETLASSVGGKGVH